jgi:hypothetical protein
MSQLLYCWRCRMEIPMLDDNEGRYVLEPMRLNEQQNRDIASAKRLVLQRYFEVTGFQETNANAIWHHQVSQYGPPCQNCGKPLRTPRATMCAACGTTVSGESDSSQTPLPPI